MTLTQRQDHTLWRRRAVSAHIFALGRARQANIAFDRYIAEQPKLPGTVSHGRHNVRRRGAPGTFRSPMIPAGNVRGWPPPWSVLWHRYLRVTNALTTTLGSITEVPRKRFDLMNGIQVRAPTQYPKRVFPYERPRTSHILTLFPPILLEKSGCGRRPT